MSMRIMLNILLLLIFVLFISFSDDPNRERRRNMVEYQIKMRGVKNENVLEAMRTVKRHLFIPENRMRDAYDDRPLPIGYGQTISQPYIVAYMTEVIQPHAGHKVLEIGTGSGYQAAVLAKIVKEVFTIEIIPDLGKAAIDRLANLGYDNVTTKIADGYYGWEEHAPYDAIVVTAATEYVPPPLLDQLKEGGKMVIPIGSAFMTQTLMLVEKKDGKARTKSLFPVRFVPFTRNE